MGRRPRGYGKKNNKIRAFSARFPIITAFTGPNFAHPKLKPR